MQLAVYLAVVFEIIFVNLLTADSCSKRRYSGAITALSLAGFSIVLVAAAMLLLGLLPFFGNGNGLFVFLAFSTCCRCINSMKGPCAVASSSCAAPGSIPCRPLPSRCISPGRCTPAKALKMSRCSCRASSFCC